MFWVEVPEMSEVGMGEGTVRSLLEDRLPLPSHRHPDSRGPVLCSAFRPPLHVLANSDSAVLGRGKGPPLC